MLWCRAVKTKTLPGVLEVFCEADYAGDLGTRNPDLEWQCGRSAVDEARGRSAEHHRTEQWRVGILRVAQVVSSCARNQGNGITGCEIHMRCDGSAARSMSARQGLAKTRHVDVRFLWLQQAVQEGRLKVLSVPTSENLSDTFTKSLSQVDADRRCRCPNFHMGNVGSGRHRKLANTCMSCRPSTM